MHTMQTQAPQPQLAKFTKKGLIIKDHRFYKGSENLWNNLAHFDNKIYSQFHKQNNMKQSLVDEKLLQEQLDHKWMEEYRKKDFMNKKSEDHSRYYQRIQERELVQTKSHQNSEHMGFYEGFGNEDAIDEFVAKKVQASRYTRLNENSWNWHNGLSRKHVDQLLTPSVLKGEEYRIRTVKKALEIGQFEKTLQEQRKLDLQQEIRETFATRREQNLQVHKQVGIPSRSADAQGFIRSLEFKERESTPPAPPETMNTMHNRLNTDRESVSAAAPFNFDRRESRDTKASVKDESFITNHKRLARSSVDDPLFQRLAIPKKEALKTFDSAQTELKGSLIKNMDREIFVPDNELCKTLVTKSKVCQEAHEDRRTTGRRTAYTKSVRNQSLPPIEDESYSIRGSTVEDTLQNPNETERVVINIEDSSSFPMNNQPFIATPVADRGSRARRDVLDEISDFEKRFSSMSIKSGFSRKELEQTYKAALPNSIQKELIKQRVIRRPSHKSSDQELEQENS